jgi:hypothetical protein
MLFSRKGCSFVPDFNFRKCCDSHDVSYKEGGSEMDRKFADEQLLADMFIDYKRFLWPTWLFMVPWCTAVGFIYYAGTKVFKMFGCFNYK